MNSLHKAEVLALLLLTSVLSSHCAPVTRLPPLLPTDAVAATPSLGPPAAAASETETATPPAVQPSRATYLSETYMMDETSGWAWAVDQADQRLLLHTSDGGRTWTPSTPGGSRSPASAPYFVYALDARVAWAILADDSLVRTSDGGQTWDTVNPRLQDELLSPAHDWYILRFENADHGWLDAGFAAAGAHEFLYETRDGGISWKPLDFESWPQDLSSRRDYKNELAFWTTIDVIFYDSSRFIIAPAEQAGTLQMFLSTNLGHSWKTVELPRSEPSGPSFDPSYRKISKPIFFDPQNGALTVTILDRNTNTTQLFVYLTSDGGLTWTLTGGPSVIHDLHSQISFLSPHDAVLICGTRFCATHDGGRTWQAFAFGTPLSTDSVDRYYQLNFIGPTTGWLLEKDFTHNAQAPNVRWAKTTDGGLSWTQLAPIIHP